MTYRLPSLGRHFCPICLSYGEHYPGCPEAIERDPPTEDDDDDEKPPTFDNHSFLE